jgi:hypothetical protein
MSEQGQVGVFWLLNGSLVMDSVPLSEAEAYGPSLLYPRGHEEVWRDWQLQDHVPQDLEYDELPRGRVSLVDGKFVILADACIARDRALVIGVISEMELPNHRTEVRTDSHYRCKVCLRAPS